MTSQFAFLRREWPEIFDSAARCELAVHREPRAACFYARRALELALHWAFKADPALRLPYQENLSALLHEPTFKQAAGEAVFAKARLINAIGNRAVHEAKAVPPSDALVAVRELFHVGYWFARTYARTERPPNLTFNPDALSRPEPKAPAAPPQTQAQLQQLEASLRERDEKLTALLADRQALSDELQRLRAEVAQARQAAAAQPDTHDYAEAETRVHLIDHLLREAGWALDQPRDREFEVSGMPNAESRGVVDYVLWGDDGRPLAVVEAKRTTRAPQAGERQATLYADCLERQFGRRPVIFYSNGYEHWLWDDAHYPPRRVQGFYEKAELELLIQRRETRRPLADAPLSQTIIERPYQFRAVRRVAEAFERDRERKALLVMATGAGKTRTVIALCDLLMRCNWTKRVLFLADRVALVNQAVNAFKRHLPDASPVNLVTERDQDGRVYVSTYPTMMGLIDELADGRRRFGPGHFDLVIIDEAHRSVFQKYGAIIDHFDSLLVGLTATPKDEVDRNTYSLFELENGVPTDSYGLNEAVDDGFLVPPRAVSVPLKFAREGIVYDQLSEEAKDDWDAVEWNDDGEVPDRVEAEAVNKWLFNKDTVDKVLEHLMTRGAAVAGGDRLGKTIIFAKNRQHANYIVERFDENYPHLKGQFAKVIAFGTDYVQTLIDDFSRKDKAPHIAVSVDMLDTGIDVPEVVNLVFFKLVRSKTKFWQMVGRGTRLCPDLFGQGRHKTFFYIFDYGQNLEFFSQQVEPTDGAAAPSLSKRLFDHRLELITVLDAKTQNGSTTTARDDRTAFGEPATDAEVRQAVADLLHRQVAAMNLDNFVVRPHRRLVEQFARPDAWVTLSAEAAAALAHDVAGLPTTLEPEGEEAKRFDLLLLNLQLALLRAEPAALRLQQQVQAIAGLLEEKAAIPMVREQMALILDLQTDEWWQNVTVPMLEGVRRKLRDLVALIEKAQRRPVFTDFEDVMGPETPVLLPAFGEGADFARFRAKAQAFLRAHQEDDAVRKLRTNQPLTSADLADLERMLVDSGIGSAGDVERAKAESHGLGLFARSLVGLDREAAKQALAGFLAGKTLSANQIEFVNLIVEHLAEHGLMEARRLYESPFTDLTPHGPEGLFGVASVDQLVGALDEIRRTAVAA